MESWFLDDTIPSTNGIEFCFHLGYRKSGHVGQFGSPTAASRAAGQVQGGRGGARCSRASRPACRRVDLPAARPAGTGARSGRRHARARGGDGEPRVDAPATGSPDLERSPPGAEGPRIEPPRLLELAEAEYPQEARAARREGKVVLKLLIDATGRVTEAEVTSPIGDGFDDGRPRRGAPIPLCAGAQGRHADRCAGSSTATSSGSRGGPGRAHLPGDGWKRRRGHGHGGDHAPAGHRARPGQQQPQLLRRPQGPTRPTTQLLRRPGARPGQHR